MCGVSGLVLRNPDNKLKAAFTRVSQRFLHERGPDAFATADITPALSFNHARLSIIDLATGSQPLQDEHGAITYNGEIYNYKDLRDARIAYKTSSDTEVLLKGLGNEGAAFLERVDGMFAFAYYDRTRNELLLARDRFGIKPLYYFHDRDRFAFASRLQPLMLFSEKRINRQAVMEYYATRACVGANTVFDDVHELEPGMAIVFDLATFSIKSHFRWAAPFVARRDITDEREALALLEEAMVLSVRRHLVSDVPVASFLSGGVDSGLLTALAAKENPQMSSLSIGFTDEKFDETRYAAAICEKYRLSHHVLRCDHRQFMEQMEIWPEVMDDVVADPSAVMITVLAKFAKERGFKVILSGEGADEIFAGYNQHYRFLLSRRLHRFVRFLPMFSQFVALAKPGQTRYIQFAKHCASDPHYYGTGRIFEPYLMPQLMAQGRTPLAPAASLSDALVQDLQHRLPDDILCRTDRATMSASVEARVPFLTRYVWDVAGRLDEKLLIRGKTQKYLLKKLAEKYVPAECIYRRKVGFDLPLAGWLRGPMKAYLQDSAAASWQGDYLHMDFMRSVIDNHLAGHNDNADKLWAFLLLEHNVRHLKGITASAF